MLYKKEFRKQKHLIKKNVKLTSAQRLGPKDPSGEPDPAKPEFKSFCHRRKFGMF